MEETPPVSTDHDWADQFLVSLRAERDRVAQFLAAHRKQAQETQAHVAAQLDGLRRQFDESQSQTSQTQRQLAERSRQLDLQAESLRTVEQEISKRQAEWDAAQQRALEQFHSLSAQIAAQQQDLEARHSALIELQSVDGRRQAEFSEHRSELDRLRTAIEEAETQLHRDRQVLALERQEHLAEVEHATALRARLEAEIAAAAEQRQELAAEQARTKAQRRRIAQEFQAQRQAHLKEIQRQRAGLERLDGSEISQLQRQIEEQTRQIEQQSAEVDRARKRELELSASAERALQREAEAVAQLEAARQRQTALAGDLETQRAQQADLEIKFRSAEELNARLRSELEAARNAESRAAVDLESREAELAELQRKLEAATDLEKRLHEAIQAEVEKTVQAVEDRDAVRAANGRLTLELESLRAELGERQALAEAAAGREARLRDELQIARQSETSLQLEVESLSRRQTAAEAELKVGAERQQRLAEELKAAREAEARQSAELETIQQRAAEADARLEAIRSRQKELVAELETAQQRCLALESEQAAAGHRDLQLRQQVEAAAGRESELETQLAAAARREATLAAERDALRERCDELEQDAARAGAVLADSAELARVRAERDRLAGDLAAAEGRIAALAEQASQGGKLASGEGDDELRRRYQLALDDVRELKSKNAALEKQLAAQGPGSSSASPSGGLDWEAEKRRILAALESQSDEQQTPEAIAERAELKDVVRRTDRMLAEKEREVDELRQLLANQSSNLGTVAVGAAALGDALDQDTIVQEERENLRRLREEWEQKLREAEVEASLERAKLARERAELEEKLRAAEERLAGTHLPGAPAAAGAAASGEKPPRGRWLSRLGLADLDEDESGKK